MQTSEWSEASALRTPPSASAPLRILRLVLALGDESAPLNQFTLAAPRDQQITICTFFPVHEKLPPWIRLIEGDGTFRGFIRRVRHALAAGGVDVVHAHSPHVAILLLIARLPASRHVPPAVATVHNSYRYFRFRNRLLLVPVFAVFDRVICCSRSSQESFPALYRRLAGDRLQTVQNGVDIARVDRAASRTQTDPRRPFTIICISRLVRHKNPGRVLEAFIRANDDQSRLILVGVGPLYDALTARSRAFGVAERVEMTGLIPRDAVYRRLGEGDLFLSASRGEGLPVAVLEAMACSIPVVLSDIPPHREIADGADFIPLLAPDDTEGFAREIRRFRSMSPKERAEIGALCRRAVERRFGVGRMLRDYRAVYDALVRERSVITVAAGAG